MVSITHRICIALIFLALVLFYAAYHHNGVINQGVFTYSHFIISITSKFSITSPPSEPSFEPAGFFINEDVAVLIIFTISIIVSTLSSLLAIWHRVKVGQSKLFIPIVFGSLAVSSCIFFADYQLGLDYSA